MSLARCATIAPSLPLPRSIIPRSATGPPNLVCPTVFHALFSPLTSKIPGMLDWDNTNIVFTKRSLIEFLKYAMLMDHHASFANLLWRYTGTTVDTNFQNVSKLPRLSSVYLLLIRCAENSLFVLTRICDLRKDLWRRF